MQSLVRGLTWPIAALVGIGMTHLAAELLRPELREVITSATVMPIYLVAGAWAGAATVRSGGSAVQGIVAGVVIGLLPVGLQLVGFGVIAGRDGATVVTSGAVGFLGLLWGSLLGTGLAASMPGRSTSVVSDDRRYAGGASVDPI
jgi:hypothetical protein